VVIAYEDLETGKRAIKTYEHMVQQLGDECLFANQMWKFDVLAVPKLNEIAAKDAAAAEIIIVSAHGCRELPAAVKSWLELALLKKMESSALVGIFDDDIGENPVRAYLAELARRAGIEFFCQPGISTGAGHTRSTNTLATQAFNNKSFAFLANATQDVPAFSHWGINE